MSILKKAVCAAVVSGLALSSPAMAASKSAPKVAPKDVRAASKVKKAQRAGGEGTSGLVYVLVGGAVVVAGVVAATSGSK